jgi:prolipoprotein diacylglyceryl transferase
MPLAYLPSPSRGLWHLGPVPVRAYALGIVLGVIVALWITDRRYRAMGGPPRMILDVATVAVPVGLVGARLYSVLSDLRAYFGPTGDWVSVFRIWDGGLGMTGLAGAAAAGAWVYCRRHGYALAPMALAAVPALAVAQAIGTWGNWFNQRMYGAPSSLPFAVAIDPAQRASGYESFSTFQPVFAYESLWDLALAAGLILAIRRWALTGDRAFALYAALYAAGRFVAEVLRIDATPRLLGIRVTEIGMLAVAVAAVAYLCLSRSRRRPPVGSSGGPSPAASTAPGAAAVSPRSAVASARSAVASARSASARSASARSAAARSAAAAPGAAGPAAAGTDPAAAGSGSGGGG